MVHHWINPLYVVDTEKNDNNNNNNNQLRIILQVESDICIFYSNFYKAEINYFR